MALSGKELAERNVEQGLEFQLEWRSVVLNLLCSIWMRSNNNNVLIGLISKIK